MKKNMYSTPEVEVLSFGHETPVLAVSNAKLNLEISRGDGEDGGDYGEVSGGYDGNWD